jgi:hypothetical protein
MTLCTAHLSRTSTRPRELKPDAHRSTRFGEILKCDWCNESYTLDYEASCTDPNDVAVVAAAARKVITEQEHLTGHRNATVEIANTIRHAA